MGYKPRGFFINNKRPFDYLKALIVEFERAYKNNMINMGGLLKAFYFDCRIRNLTQKTISGYGEVLKLFLQYLEKATVPFEQVSSLTDKYTNIVDFIVRSLINQWMFLVKDNQISLSV